MSLNTIFQVFVPKDKKFFPMFENAAENLVQGAIKLNKLLLIEDAIQIELICKEIKEIEHIGDEITHGIFNELDRTFITPFDREDIHNLASCLDDVLDLINSAAQSIRMYQPKKLTSEFLAISEFIVQGSREIKIAMSELRNLKKPYKITDACIKINEIENLADDVFHEALSDLFKHESDAIELIKKKDIIQTMESATDLIEQVSNVLNTILIKMA